MAFPGWKTENKTHRTFFFFLLVWLAGEAVVMSVLVQGEVSGREGVGWDKRGRNGGVSGAGGCGMSSTAV